MDSAGLSVELDKAIEVNNEINANWSNIKDWKEYRRYETKSREEAEDLLESIIGSNGLLQWIQQYW